MRKYRTSATTIMGTYGGNIKRKIVKEKKQNKYLIFT
jgi:hypothetical protein